MTKIAILGGSFNPIHNGHIHMAEQVLSLGLVEKVWLVPCYKHTHNKELVNPNIRLKMCKLAVASHPSISVCDFEIVNEMSGSTLLLMRHLKKDYNRHTFSVIIGQDNANNITSWKNSEKLLNENNFIIFQRPPIKKHVYDIWSKYKGNEFIKNFVPISISSTQIREWLGNEDPVINQIPKGYLMKDVYKFIKQKGLYGTNNY